MRLWTNIFLPIKSPLEFLLTGKDETIVRKLNDTHKTNDSLLLPSAFADWVSGKLSLCLAADGADKSQKPLEIRTFRQKESTAILIRFVSKLRCLFGGPEEIRTLDLSDANRTLSQLSYRPIFYFFSIFLLLLTSKYYTCRINSCQAFFSAW